MVDMTPSFTVTPRAAQRIAHVLSDEPAGAVLRISVEGGGCSGFQYRFDIGRKAADDLLIEQDGATVAIDPISLQFVGGAALDYVEDLLGATFRMDNPKATAKCGCGMSFTL